VGVLIDACSTVAVRKHQASARSHTCAWTVQDIAKLGVLRVQVCCALAQVAKHSVDMAEVVVEAEIFPKLLTCLAFPDPAVRKAAATVVREARPRSLCCQCCSTPCTRFLCVWYCGCALCVLTGTRTLWL
jgi:hypothetical protein